LYYEIKNKKNSALKKRYHCLYPVMIVCHKHLEKNV